MEDKPIKKLIKIFLSFVGINLLPFALLWIFTPAGKYEIEIITNNSFRLLMDIILIVIPAIIFSLIFYFTKNKIFKYTSLLIALLIFYTFLYYYINPVLVNYPVK